MAREVYRYNHLTWQEMNDAIERQPVILLPVGSTEQHGPHLPLDVDVFLCEEVCLETARRMPGKALVLPAVSYGLNLHHIDFPGTIHIEPEVFIAFCLNVTKSVAYHGFRRILVVNGHGSNGPLVDLVARKTLLGTESICAAVSYYVFGQEAFEGVKESAVTAHADEFETSLYLHLAPEGADAQGSGGGRPPREAHELRQHGQGAAQRLLGTLDHGGRAWGPAIGQREEGEGHLGRGARRHAGSGSRPPGLAGTEAAGSTPSAGAVVHPVVRGGEP